MSTAGTIPLTQTRYLVWRRLSSLVQAVYSVMLWLRFQDLVDEDIINQAEQPPDPAGPPTAADLQQKVTEAVVKTELEQQSETLFLCLGVLMARALERGDPVLLWDFDALELLGERLDSPRSRSMTGFLGYIKARRMSATLTAVSATQRDGLLHWANVVGRLSRERGLNPTTAITQRDFRIAVLAQTDAAEQLRSRFTEALDSLFSADLLRISASPYLQEEAELEEFVDRQMKDSEQLAEFQSERRSHLQAVEAFITAVWPQQALTS